jgi:hypothetical protein
MTNRTNYIDTRKRKSFMQKALFEEEDEPSTPPSKEAPVIPDAEKREAPCDDCKKPIIYSSNDLRPGIICPSCGHGQNNPNLRGKTWS